MLRITHVFVAGFIALMGFNCAVAQTGINTINPRKTLEVGGDMITDGQIEIGITEPLTNFDSTFLVQQPDGTVNSINVTNPTAQALAYVQEYIITDTFEDFIDNFNTLVSTADYNVIVISANFSNELSLNRSAALGGPTISQDQTYSVPYVSSYEQGGTWRLRAKQTLI